MKWHCPVGFIWSLLLILGGCISVDPRVDYRRVDEHVREATGTAAPERPEDAAAVSRLIEERLADGLTASEALELCLLNNPRIRAAYLRVGVARADVVQAGLFQNPSLSLSLRFPDGGGLSNLELAIAQNIAELWLIPARTRAAEGDLQRETLEVAREISAAVLDARAAYFTALAAGREQEIAGQNREVARQLLDAALARQQAGLGGEIDVNLARTELMQTEIVIRAAALTVFEARRRLCVLLGLTTPPGEVVLADALPDPTSGFPAEDELLQTAARARLDLVAAGYLAHAAAARVEQEKLSVVTNMQVGVSFEQADRRPSGGRSWLADTLWASAEAGRLAAPSLRPEGETPTNTVLGPTLTLELPVFDQNQAQIARAQYVYQAAVANREALLLEVTQETRAALVRTGTAWDISRYYRDNLLPLVERNLELSREAYRSGKLSLLAVLEAQKALLAARNRYVAVLREGAVALTELEKAVGLPAERFLPGSTSAPATRTAAPQGDGESARPATRSH